MWPRIIPFAVYMGFIGLSPILTGLFSSAQGGETLNVWVYPVKTAVVGGLLLFFWLKFEETQDPCAGELAGRVLGSGRGSVGVRLVGKNGLVLGYSRRTDRV